MEVFNLTFTQMLMLFTLILVGFLLKKKNILSDNAGTIMSRLETYVFLPALNFSNTVTNCTVETFKENSTLILYGTILTMSAWALSYPISRLFVRKAKGNPKLEYQRNVYKYALTFGNYGFMGNAIILGIFGSEMLFKYNMFNLITSLICTGWGLHILTPQNKTVGRFKGILKSLLSPPIIALFLGLVAGLLNVRRYIPEFAMTTLANASACMGPVAMLLVGFIIGGYKVKSLFNDTRVYVMTALRLIVIPAVMVIILKLIGTNDEIITLALIAFATPIGLNTIVFPAAYGGDTRIGASMALISNALAVVTIPLMYLLFIIVL